MSIRPLVLRVCFALVLAGAAGVALAARAPAAPPPLDVRTAEFGGVYYPGDVISLVFTAQSAPYPATVSYRIVDFDGEEAIAGEANVQWQALDDGRGRATVSLSVKPPLGFYSIQAWSGNLKAQGSFVVVPPPGDSVPAAQSCMGMVLAPVSRYDGQIEGFLRAARRMGARWMSTDVPVSSYAPTADQLAFDVPAGGRLSLDQVVNACQKEGLALNQKIFGVPAWLASVATDETRSPWYRDCYTSPIKDKAGYQRVITAMARRYRGKILSYEYGNSPFREPRYYCGTNEDFIRDLAWTHEAVKAGDPDALVMAAGFVQKTDLVEDILRKAPHLIDVLTVHYITADAGENKPPQWYYVAPPSWYHELFRKTGVTKPMWDTSAIGIPSDDQGIRRGHRVVMSEAGVAEQGVIRSVTRNLAHGISKTMFSALNIGGNHNDIFTRDDQAKSSVCEYAVAARELDGAQYLGRVATDSPLLEGYYFSKDGDVRAVVWHNVNGQGGDVTLAAAGASCTVVDRFGRESTLAAADGTVKLAVGFRPVIVRGLKAPAN